MKDFIGWNEKKIKLDGYKKYKHPKVQEIWWCSIGVNVGTEIYGKGEYYLRPVIIINAEIGESFIGIPLTSRIKTGKYCCVVKVKEGKLSTALIHQIRNFDKRRLIKKIGILELENYKKVLNQLCVLYKI
jgi:mRNA interferase MazF